MACICYNPFWFSINCPFVTNSEWRKRVGRLLIDDKQMSFMYSRFLTEAVNILL